MTLAQQIATLKEKRASAIAVAASIKDVAVKDNNREMTATELESFRVSVDESEGYKNKISALQKQLDIQNKYNEEVEDINTINARVVKDTAISDDLKERVTLDPKRGFKNFADFGLAVQSACSPGNHSVNTNLRVLAAATGMSQGVGSDGGFLVPPEFNNTIWDGMNSMPLNLMALVDQYVITGESLTINANAETSRATGSRFGGIRGYWLAEAAQATASKPTFRKLKLEPHQLAVMVYVTDKLLANAVSLQSYLSRAAIEEITFMVNDAIINGDGAGKPRGILAAGGGLVTILKESSQVAATVVQENVSKMWARLHPNSRSRALWLHNVDVEPQFDQLNTKIKNVAGTENVGGITNVVYNSEKNSLKGRPLMPTEFNATLGTVGDLILLDPKGYAVGLQGAIDTALSMHLRFDYAETAFRFMFAIDGQPYLSSALTPYKGSATLSTHVVCETRS